MADLAQHPLQDVRVLLLDRAPDLRQAEREQRAAVALALADLTADLGDAELRHLRVVLLLARALRLLLGDRLGLRLRHGSLRSLDDGRNGSCGLFDLGLLATRRERQDLADLLAADLRDVLRTAQLLERGDGRLRHVDWVRRPERLREHVADAAELEHGADAAAGDDAGALGGGAQHDARGVEVAGHLVRDRRAVLRHREQVLLRVLDGLRDRERDLARLAVADADAVDLVADDDERREREPPAALDDLGDAVDLDHALLELAGLLVIDSHLEAQTSLARAVGERLDPAVVQVAGTVEDDGVDAGRLRVLREQLADLGRLPGLVALERGLQRDPRGRRERLALEVVHELRRDAAVRAGDDEARALGGALHLATDAPVAALPGFEDAQTRHASRPFCGRTRPRSGCPCP